MLIVIAAIPLDSPWVPAQQWIPGSSPRFGIRFSKHLLNSFMGWPRSSSGLDCITPFGALALPGWTRVMTDPRVKRQYFFHISPGISTFKAISINHLDECCWWFQNMNFIFHNIWIYGMSSFPLTNSIIFQRGRLKPPTRDWLICLWILINDGWWLY